MDSKNVPVEGDEGKMSAENMAEDHTADSPVEEALEGDEVARLTRQVEEYLTGLRYLQADFENYKRRVVREKEETIKNANESLIIELLEPYENMERAVANARKTGDEQMARGIEMVYAQMTSVFNKRGLKPIESIGKPFDPRLHEALMQEESQGVKDGTVLDEFQRGYTLNSKVIRCSKVKVSKR